MPPTRGAPSLSEMVTALEHNEIICHYQPKIDIKTGACIGVEALARWHAPDGSPILPGQFIAKFFKAGLSAHFTMTVLHAAATDTVGYPNLNVSVNTNLELFEDPTLSSQIVTVLEAAHLDPNRLTIEITENDGYLFGGGPPSAERIFRDLTDLGVRFSLDDYGTGRATLERLRSYPFHELKHARPHLDGIVDNPLVQDLIHATNNLAHSMGITVVAEGIETLPQLRAAEEVGCDSAQGFLIAHPMPHTELAAWCSQRRVQLSQGK